MKCICSKEGRLLLALLVKSVFDSFTRLFGFESITFEKLSNALHIWLRERVGSRSSEGWFRLVEAEVGLERFWEAGVCFGYQERISIERLGLERLSSEELCSLQSIKR